MTGKTDFQTLVFTKNFSTDTPQSNAAAWQVIEAQSGVKFSYPSEIKVGATYKNGDQNVPCGPFDAPLGSTWQITQPT